MVSEYLSRAGPSDANLEVSQVRYFSVVSGTREDKSYNTSTCGYPEHFVIGLPHNVSDCSTGDTVQKKGALIER